MGPIRGIIFDFDGTILDTESAGWQAWRELYEEHGCDFPFEPWAAGLGGDGAGFDSLAHLEGLMGRAIDRDALRARRDLRKHELVTACEVRDGVVAYLDEAEHLGLRLGLASSSKRDWVEQHLDRIGLLGRFQVLSCGDDVPRTKPDPALYVRTLDLLGLRPEEAIAIEDSPNGVRAARAAGVYCVAVPNPVTARLPLDHADLVIPSLVDVPVADLINRIGSPRTAG